MAGRVALIRRFDALRADLDSPSFLLLRAVLRVHEPQANRGKFCRCCPSPKDPRGSPHATEVEFRVLEELIVDLATGERHRKADLTADAWKRFEDRAEPHEVTMRCSRSQVGMLLDDTGRHILAAGSNRSGKTTLGLYWLALQWIRRGGRECRFWLVASTLPKAFRLLQKLFDGTGESPPILPLALVARRPPTARSGDLITRMVDGSWIDLRYFEGDPSAERLKSDAIVAAIVDEAAHLGEGEDSEHGANALAALKGRCLDARGRLFFASTPRPKAYIKTAVVDEAAAFARLADDDPKRIAGEHPGALWRVESLAIPANPWLDAEEVRRQLAAANPDDPATRRDFFGEWVSNSGPLWRDFSEERQILRHEARHFDELGPTVRAALGVEHHIDVTAAAVRFIAGRGSPHVRGLQATNMKYLLGQDINCHPLSTCVMTFSAPPETATDRDTWVLWVWDVIVSNEGGSLHHAEKLASLRFARIRRPTDDTSPFNGACIVTDASAMTRDPTAHRYGTLPHGLPESFGKLGFDIRAPSYSYTGRVCPLNPSRYDSHMLLQRFIKEKRFYVHQRCGTLIQSLCEQQDSGDGVAPEKTSHDRADRLASPIDALRYPLWAAMKGGRQETTIRQM